MHIFFNNKNFSTLHKLKVVAITFCHFVEKNQYYDMVLWVNNITKKEIKSGIFYVPKWNNKGAYIDFVRGDRLITLVFL